MQEIHEPSKWSVCFKFHKGCAGPKVTKKVLKKALKIENQLKKVLKNEIQLKKVLKRVLKKVTLIN